MSDEHKPCAIEPAKREVIENRLLAAMTEEDKVAIVLNREDLDMLIRVFSFRMNTAKEAAYLMDLKKLQQSAFGVAE